MQNSGRPKADASDHQIGDRVRARRLLLGLTQEKLGDALGVSFQQVQKYEKGANRISASRLSQIATALDVPIMHFYEAAGGVIDSACADGVAVDPARASENAELLSAFARVKDPLVRQRIVELVEIFAASR